MKYPFRTIHHWKYVHTFQHLDIAYGILRSLHTFWDVGVLHKSTSYNPYRVL